MYWISFLDFSYTICIFLLCYSNNNSEEDDGDEQANESSDEDHEMEEDVLNSKSKDQIIELYQEMKKKFLQKKKRIERI